MQESDVHLNILEILQDQTPLDSSKHVLTTHFEVNRPVQMVSRLINLPRSYHLICIGAYRRLFGDGKYVVRVYYERWVRALNNRPKAEELLVEDGGGYYVVIHRHDE